MICTKCNKEKIEDMFAKRKIKRDGTILRHRTCKECQKILSKEHYNNNKNAYKLRNIARKQNLYNLTNESKKNGCVICNESEPCTLDFHHINKDEKSFTISHRVRDNNLTTETLAKEIAKCVILCANCHRKLHAEIFSLLNK
jgi:hypothetical protein